MRTLITGAAGMLGSAVYPTFAEAGHETIATDLVPREVNGLAMSKLDVRDYAAVRETIRRFRPGLVLHLAAETDLEICEEDPDHAFLTNTVGSEYVALACREFDATMVYISTAGVFDGKKSGAYTEFDPASPINVYGQSKYEGEVLALRLVPRHFVVRAGWMIGGGNRDHKFVRKIIDQLDSGSSSIHAVTDKLGTPTYTKDFASNLLALVSTSFYGRFHMACTGEGSRYDVALEIVRRLGRGDVDVIPVTSDYFAETYFAPRPASEIMRNFMLDLHGLNRMRPWQMALAEYLDASGLSNAPNQQAARHSRKHA